MKNNALILIALSVLCTSTFAQAPGGGTDDEWGKITMLGGWVNGLDVRDEHGRIYYDYGDLLESEAAAKGTAAASDTNGWLFYLAHELYTLNGGKDVKDDDSSNKTIFYDDVLDKPRTSRLTDTYVSTVVPNYEFKPFHLEGWPNGTLGPMTWDPVKMEWVDNPYVIYYSTAWLFVYDMDEVIAEGIAKATRREIEQKTIMFLHPGFRPVEIGVL